MPERSAQGTDILTFVVTGFNPGDVVLSNVVPTGAVQMNADGRTLEAGPVEVDVRNDTEITFDATVTDDNGSRTVKGRITILGVNTAPSVVSSATLQFDVPPPSGASAGPVSEKAGLSLVTGAFDAEGDPISVRKVNGSVIDWSGGPHEVQLSSGKVVITEAGQVTYDDEGDVLGHPLDGQSGANGSFTFTLWDGLAESAQGTRSIQLNGVASQTSIPGLVFDIDPENDVVLSGSDVTTVTDQVAGIVLTALGTPTIIQTPASVDAIQILSGEGLKSAVTTGLPVGAAPRTSIIAVRPYATNPDAQYGGLAWGDPSAFAAWLHMGCFTNSAPEVSLGVYAARVGAISCVGQWVISIATYDGANTITLWIGSTKVGTLTLAQALATGTGQLLIGLFFGDETTRMDVARAQVYDRVLTDAEIRAKVIELNAIVANDTSITDPAAPTGSLISPTGFTFSGTASQSYGYTLWAVTTSATPLTKAEIRAGTGALAFGQIARSNTTSYSQAVTGATVGQTYYVHTFEAGLLGDESGVVVSSGITTDTADVTAPVLSSPTGTQTGTSTADGTVSTDEANGTLFWVIAPAAESAPTADQIIAGQLAAGTDAGLGRKGSKTVTATGTQSVSGTLMKANTAYKFHYCHRDASSNKSNVASSASFTTASGALPLYDQILALRDDPTTRGRQSTNTLKVPGTDTLPTGVVLNGTVLNFTSGYSAGTDFADWDLRGLLVIVQSGAHVGAITECLFGGAAAQDYSFVVTVEVGARVDEISWCSFVGDFILGGGTAWIKQNFAGSGANIQVGDLRHVTRCVFTGQATDAIKAGGCENTGTPQLIDYNYFGPMAFLNSVLLGTWSATTTYAQGETVLFRKTNSQTKAFESKINGNVGNNPQTSGQWTERDPHGDCVT
ncbi:MAG: hypothetical protein HXY25_06895, partial [Alphaproteobacteria bacterium]|nr:hypothetical protein [Alphaproteobacteria bacterium]